MAEHYARHLSSVMKPQLFVSISSQSPIGDVDLESICSAGFQYYARNTKGVAHLQVFTADGEQPIRNLSAKSKSFNHLHAVIGTDCEITEDNFKQHIKEFLAAMKGAAKRTKRGRQQQEKEMLKSCKGSSSFSSVKGFQSKPPKLDIDIKLITDDGVKAGRYVISKHKKLTVHPVICAHKTHKCNRKIEWEHKEETIQRPVVKNGVVRLSKRATTKKKKVCGHRVCNWDHNLERRNKDTTRTPASIDDGLRRQID
jgi:hypothetical protein